MTVTAFDSNSAQPPGGDRRVVARAFALTDVGRSREHNEDTFLVADLETGAAVEFEEGFREVTADAHGLLFLVADGMGGAASGELASRMAGELVLEGLRRQWTRNANFSPASFAEALRDVTLAANARIHQHARENLEHRGMGTTATIAGLLGDWLYLVQVGDSRAYLVRDGAAQQLTKDQSLMQRLVEAGELTPEQAEVSDRRNIILQALGPEAQITVDLTHQQLRKGDTLILCSDGLSGLVRAEEIATLTVAEPDVRLLCRKLVDRANARGGPDNITVVAVQFEGEGLAPSVHTDTVGHTAFPLAGTLFEQTTELSIGPRASRTPATGDATPKEGVRRPTPTGGFAVAAPDAPFAEKRMPVTSDNPVVETPAAVAAALSPVMAQRRRAAQPVFFVLALVAIAAVAWTAIQVIRG